MRPDDAGSGRPTRIAVIGDLHCSVGSDALPDDPPESFFHDDLLADLIDGFRHPDDRVDTLVLLGDVFELPGGVMRGRLTRRYHEVRLADLLDRLDRILAAHRLVVEALAAYLADGGRIHVVPGNHDLALHHPVVMERLRGAVAETGRTPALAGRIVYEPIAFRARGLLYAEHGHRHDALNTLWCPAAPWSQEDGASALIRFEDPVGAALHRLHVAHRAGRGPSVVALASAARSAWFDATGSFTGGRAAARRAIDAIDAADAIDVPIARSSQLAWRVGRRCRSALPVGRPDPGGHYLHRAARSVHARLAGAGMSEPIYAFGHSHRAEAFEIADGAWYLNAGSWSSRSSGAAGRRTALPYGVVSDQDGGPRCELRWVDVAPPRSG